jgi:hypothetical protein
MNNHNEKREIILERVAFVLVLMSTAMVYIAG